MNFNRMFFGWRWQTAVWLVVLVVGGLLFGTVPYTQAQTLLFEENFDGLTPGTDVTVDNTGFDYRRIGTQGGSITAEETNGEVHMRLGGASGGSLNGVGMTGGTDPGDATLGGANVTTLNFRMRMESTDGTIFFGMGDGNMFTGNGTFATSQLMWAIQSNNGLLQHQIGTTTSNWQPFNPSITLVENQNYEFHIIANNSGSMVTYDAGNQTISSGRMHAYLNDDFIGDVPIGGNVNAHGFRIYQVNNGLYARFDSITIYEGAVDPFTPTAVSLANIGVNTAVSTGFLLILLLVVVGTAVGLLTMHRYQNN
jgi:hypothetical protein